MENTISFGDKNLGFQAGTINGPVNTEFHHHAAPERPETPPSISGVIPFSRDTDFIKRGGILDLLHQKCSTTGSRTALVGLGGVGKSQLAIEYAYQTRDRSPDTWVFWVHASNAARFEQSFRDIANYVKITDRQNPKADIFQLVHDWLRDERKGKWVLILDNVDDASFLLDTRRMSRDGQTNDENSRPLVWYLPQSQNGSILITTRSREAARKLVIPRNIIAVEPMSKADALALFEKKLGAQNDSNDVAALAYALEYMPLAIIQASAYICEQQPFCSVKQYLADFQDLLSNNEEAVTEFRRDYEAKNSIILTWQISFDHIRQKIPSAANLLSLMSFFDCQGIPGDLLRNRSESGDGQQTEYKEDSVKLRNYSFISINTDGKTFEMHSLVQLATRKWLEDHGQLEKWKQQFISNLCAELPTGEYENWAKCQELFPHARSAARQQPQAQESLRDWASVLYKAAWYAWTMGNGLDAENMSFETMKVWKKILGEEHEDSLNSMAMLGLAHNLRGRWDAAEGLFVQVMETRKAKLGADHPDTLTSMANLASTYRNQGRWGNAEELFVQVMETRKTKLGADHPSTLMAMWNLAYTWKEQGRTARALILLRECVHLQRQILKSEHPHYISSSRMLADWEAKRDINVSNEGSEGSDGNEEDSKEGTSETGKDLGSVAGSTARLVISQTK